MSVPIAGKSYTIVSGDTLTRIAAIAYGDGSKWRKIYNANQTSLKSGDPDVIFPGEVIIIPTDEIIEKEKKFIDGADPDSMIIRLEDIELEITEGAFIRTMDTCADAWTCSMPWFPGQDEKFDELTYLYRKQKPISEIYLGGELFGTGYLYKPINGFSDSGRIKTLEFFSKTVDLVDSNLKPPYEFNNVDLKQHATALCDPFGIQVKFLDSQGGRFDKITADKDDTVFAHLKKYAAQRSLLISCDEFGDLVFQKAQTEGDTVGSITEEEQNTTDWSASFDQRNVFNSYRVISQTPGGNAKTEVVKDDNIIGTRFKTIDAPDSIAGGVKDVAAWERSKTVNEALSQTLPQSGWRDPNGNFWNANTKADVTSLTLGIPNGREMLISKVKFSIDNSGVSSDLSIVPPEVYTGEPINDLFV